MGVGNEWEQEPRAGERYGGAPRSGAVTAVGILGIIVGAIEVIMCGITLVAGGFVSAGGRDLEREVIRQGNFNPQQAQQVSGVMGVAGTFLIVISLLGIIFAVFRIVAGIGVLNRRGWARITTIVFASITILLAILLLLSLQPLNLLVAVLYIGYIIASFVILLNGQNAAEFRA